MENDDRTRSMCVILRASSLGVLVAPCRTALLYNPSSVSFSSAR